MNKTILCELLAVKLESGRYTVYVFKNLDDDTYLMCTKLPNWDGQVIELGDIGYLSYNNVRAGDKWYNHNEDMYVAYRFSGIYFDKFIKKPDKVSYEDIKIT